MMLLGTAGTGKSRTVRSFVGSRRNRVREDLACGLRRAQLAGEARDRGRVERGDGSVSGGTAGADRNVAEMLGVSREDALAAAAAFERARVSSAAGRRRKRR